jgi:hypothetical protein
MFLFFTHAGFDSFILFYLVSLGYKEEVQMFKIDSFCYALQCIKERLSGNDGIIIPLVFGSPVS